LLQLDGTLPHTSQADRSSSRAAYGAPARQRPLASGQSERRQTHPFYPAPLLPVYQSTITELRLSPLSRLFPRLCFCSFYGFPFGLSIWLRFGFGFGSGFAFSRFPLFLSLFLSLSIPSHPPQGSLIRDTQNNACAYSFSPPTPDSIRQQPSSYPVLP
jgi:hypothetical protein